ncbi:hypothetical protein HELRODRAFT_184541, partial [Helobdella robusta]|uniref:Uncharacterized protein n=1 Tax=Helobdella robusta TaxID=6412 RepID=T1FLF5_HELRO
MVSGPSLQICFIFAMFKVESAIFEDFADVVVANCAVVTDVADEIVIRTFKNFVEGFAATTVVVVGMAEIVVLAVAVDSGATTKDTPVESVETFGAEVVANEKSVTEDLVTDVGDFSAICLPLLKLGLTRQFFGGDLEGRGKTFPGVVRCFLFLKTTVFRELALLPLPLEVLLSSPLLLMVSKVVAVVTAAAGVVATVVLDELEYDDGVEIKISLGLCCMDEDFVVEAAVSLFMTLFCVVEIFSFVEFLTVFASELVSAADDVAVVVDDVFKIVDGADTFVIGLIEARASTANVVVDAAADIVDVVAGDVTDINNDDVDVDEDGSVLLIFPIASVDDEDDVTDDVTDDLLVAAN